MKKKEVELLEKLFKKSPELKNDYGYLLDIWWKAPEERAIITKLKAERASGISNILLGGVVAIGALSLAGMIFDFGAIGLGTLLGTGVLLGASLLQIAKATKLKKEAFREFENYKEALKNKVIVDQSIKESSKIMKNEIINQFEKSLTRAENMNHFKEIIKTLISMIEGAKQQIENIYNENKRFEFNLFEQEEVDAFSKVDSYQTFSKEYSFWVEVLVLASHIKNIAANNDEELFIEKVNELITQFK